MSSLARSERAALCDTFVRVGPEAPTLCDPWTTADLAAHLVVRERRPDAVAGIWFGPLAGRTEEVQAGYAAKPWPELVDLVRSGPPPWSPTRLSVLDDATNLMEFFIHHEDVLRAESTGPQREISPRLSAALWAGLGRVATLAFRRSPVGVVLEDLDGARVTARSETDIGTVILRGAPAELVLTASGRRRVADLEVMGGAEAVAALWAAPLGLT
jgi:uncharacterized protein (TIGR03085 family)